MKPGAWLIVAGGWNEQQFVEKRRPTQAELEAAAPNNPVYVQLGYGWVAMTEEGFAALGIKADADLPRGARLELDAAGKPLGTIAGSNPGIVALFDRLPKPTYAEQVEGTRAFFRELNRLGLTGVGDPGGNNLAPPDYAALFDVWRRGQMTVRVRYSLNGQTRGKELDEFKAWTGLLPMGFGDDWLKFIGLGERVTEAMNNNPSPTAEDLAKYQEIARWAAGRGLGLTMHWGPDATVRQLLDIFERVNRDVPLAPLRWSIAHLNDASEASLERMRGAGHRLDGAGRDVLRRRRLRAPERRRRGTPCASGGHGVEVRRSDRRRHGRAPRRLLQSVHRAAVVPRRQDRERPRDSRARRRRRAGWTRCGSTPSAAPGSRTRIAPAVRSKPASWPTSPCCRRTTSRCRWRRSAPPYRC